MGDTRIWSAGIYWDQNKFPNRTYFAPYAYKEELNTRKFKVIHRFYRLFEWSNPRYQNQIEFVLNNLVGSNWFFFIFKKVEDLSRLNKTNELYTNEEWFKVLKSRWSNYYDTLEKYWIKMYFRSDEQGDNIYLRKYEHFPEYYR